MSFFAPWMLLGLIAAAAPIIIHLFRRKTAEHVRWGAWMFLFESLKRKRRRLMLEDVILLILRTLMLALAAFAFARPFLPELSLFGGRGMDKDVVIVFDASASMRLKDATGRSAFDRSLEEARELIKLSPRGTSFGVVLGERTPTILTPSPLSSKGEILDLLDELKPGDDTMDAPRTLAAAGAVLSGGNSPAKEIIVYGDGQGYGWRPSDEAEWKRVERIFSAFHRRPPVVWRTLERPSNVKNAAIASVTPSRRIIGTDRPVTFSVTIVNSGSEAFSPGDVVLTVDGTESARSPVGQILPGLSRTYEFPCPFEKSGRHEIVTSLTQADDIASDSTVTNAVDVLDALDVLLVNGRPSENGFARPTAFLDAALRPELKGTNAVFLVRPKTIRAAELENAEILKGVHVTVLCDVPMLPPKAETNLVRWAKAGGGVLAVPGQKATGAYYTNALFAVATTNFNAKLKEVTFRGAPVSGRAEIDERAITNGLEVVARFSDGAAAVVSGPLGAGRTAVSAVPFDLGWTTLPARPDFVPFVHGLVYSLAGTNSVTADVDFKWRAREGDLSGLEAKDAEALSVHIDLGNARSADDALSAIVGKSFGVEIWRPIAIVAFLLLIAEILLCRRLDGERGGRVRSHFRIAMRAISVLALVWMLLHISWIHDRTRKIHRRVAVFTDHSLSMQRADATSDGHTNSVVRYQLATNAAARIGRSLARRYDVEPFEFGATTTDFSDALELALRRIPSEELAGAVFLTDGRSTVEVGPEAAARRFARLGAKISSVVVGCASNRTDVAIEALRSAENVFLGDKVRVGVRIRADGLDKKHVVVKFMEGDSEIERREFDVEGASWTKDVRFVHDPGEKGVKNYSVRVEPVEGDAESLNDVWPFDVAVSDDRTNVLVADRRPRWEYRYLRNLFFARDKSVHLQYLLTEPDQLAESFAPAAPAADATRAFGEAEAGRLPQKRDDWRKFEVIVLGDLPRDVLTDEVCENIRYCVEERGALLCVIAGQKHMPYDYVDTPLGRIFPVSLTNEFGDVTAAWRDRITPFALTPSGSGHPATAVATSLSENERIWNSIPPARGRIEGLSVRPGAEVLLFAGDTTALAAPLVTVRETGRGKVAFFATDETWHLRYRKGDTYHHRFWGNMLRWGAGEKLRDGNLYARAGTDQLHYLPESEVRLAVRLSDAERLPITDAATEAEVKLPDGTKRTVQLVKRTGSNGYYEALFDATAQEGRYEVTVKSEEAEKKLGADWPGPLTTVFNVDRGIAPVEYAFLTADETVVREMARLTGGEVVPLDRAKELDEAFGAGKSEIVEHVETPIWDHWLALTLLALSLILTWLSRKRKGLA